MSLSEQLLDSYRKMIGSRFADPSLNPSDISLILRESIRACGLEPRFSRTQEGLLFGAGTQGITPAADILDFFKLVEKILAYEREYGAKAPHAYIRFKKALLETDEFESPIITWKIKHRQPGIMSRGDTKTSSPTRERSAHRRAMYDDPSHLGYVLATYGAMRDNIVEFCISSTDPTEAEYLALWFEDLMEKWAWFFTFHGVQRVLFESRESESSRLLQGTTIYQVPILYWVRTEKIFVISSKTLDSVSIKLCIQGSDS